MTDTCRKQSQMILDYTRTLKHSIVHEKVKLYTITIYFITGGANLAQIQDKRFRVITELTTKYYHQEMNVPSSKNI